MSLNAKIQYEQVIMTISSLIIMGAKRSIRKDNTRTSVDPSKANTQQRRIVFTWNNPSDDWKDFITNNKKLMENVQYLIAEEEYGEKKGTLHIQGYIRFNKKLYRSTIRSLLPGFWFECARGSEISNIKYCTKTKNNVLQLGEPYASASNILSKEQETSQMLKDVVDLNDDEFEAKYPYISFYHWNKIQSYKIRKTQHIMIWSGDLQAKNYWLWGDAGTGKSTWARKQWDNLDQIFKKNLNKWWDGFRDGYHKIVIIDEMNPSKSVLSDQLKDWGDRFPFKGEVKGAAMDINPGKFFFIITANYSIDDCFSNEEDRRALKRRFNEINIKNKNDIFLKTFLDKTILSE